MDALSLYLQDYKDLIATTASITTIGQFFSGVFICKDMYKKGNTENISLMPFLGGAVIGTLFLQLGYLMNDAAMIQVNIAAIVLNMLYMLCYFVYTEDKEDVIKQTGYGIAFIAVLLGYVRWESPDLIEYRFSMIVTILMLGLLGSPLIEVGEIIRTKNAEKLPFPIIFSACIVTFQWLLYGIILKNEFMIFQNIVGFVLCFVQLILCIIYPSVKIDEKKKDK